MTPSRYALLASVHAAWLVALVVSLSSCLYRPPPGATVLPLIPKGYQWLAHHQNAYFHDRNGSQDKAIMNMTYACEAIRTPYRKEPREYTNCMIQLGRMYYAHDKYWLAIEAYRAAAPSAMRWHHPGVVEYPLLLSGLAEAHIAIGEISTAKTYAEEALRVERSADRRLSTTSYLSNLAYIHELMGDWATAEALYEKALIITESELCRDHPDALIHLEDLGRIYWRRGKHAAAVQAYDRVVRGYQGGAAYEHEQASIIYSHLGDIHFYQDRTDAAERMYQDALEQEIELFDGVEHREGCYRSEIVLARPWSFREWFDSSSSNQWFRPVARVFRRCKRYGERQQSMQNLASIYMSKGQLHKARVLYEKMLKLAASSGDAPDLQDTTIELARLYALQGDIQNAEKLYIEASSLIGGDVSSRTARHTSVLRERARLNLVHGRYDLARTLIEVAMEEDLHVFFPNDANIADNLGITAELHLQGGSLPEAMDAWTRAIELDEGLGSARGRQQMSDYTGLGRVQLEGGQRKAAIQSFTEALSIGASLPDAGAETIPAHSGLVTAHWLDGDFPEALSSLQQISAREEVLLTSLFSAKDEGRMLEMIEASMDTVYKSLSLHLGHESRKVPTERFATELVLNRKGYVVELLSSSYPMVHEDFPHDKGGLIQRAIASRAGVAKFEIRGLRRSSLGPGYIFGLQRARKEQQAIESFLLGSIRPRTPRTVTIDEVQARLLPDDALVEFLWYVPFDPSSGIEAEPRYAACVIRDDRVDWVDLGGASEIDEAIERFTQDLTGRADIEESGLRLHERIIAPLMPHLTSARRLFISPDAELRRISFVTIPMGDGKYLLEHYLVHYLNSGRDLLRPWSRFAPSLQPALVIANPKGSQLPGTMKEVKIVRDAFGDVDVWKGEGASEVRFRELSRPWMLHIGAHGFSLAKERRSVGSTADPMVFSGLKMAEPNLEARRSADKTDDGLLSAYEISWVDLRGTQLVTLSACSSGLGTIKAGEGVLGLQRSIAIAGAQSVVMSLWDVSDELTPGLMKAFYRNLQGGEARDESMRQAQLHLRNCEGYEHPYSWGSFVVIGEWGPLTLPEQKRRLRRDKSDEDMCHDARQPQVDESRDRGEKLPAD